MELSIGEAVNLTRDREKWRSLVATSSSANGWRKWEPSNGHTPKSSGPYRHSSTVIGTLAVDGWALTFGTARIGLGQSPPRCRLPNVSLTAHPSTASVPAWYFIRCGTGLPSHSEGLTFNGQTKPQSYGPLYSNTVIGTLAVDGWAVTFGTARRGLGGLGPRPVPSSLYQM